MSHSHSHSHPSGENQGLLRRAALISFGLSALKLALGLAAGSLAVLASAADSFSDGAMSAINAWGYAWAREPADAGHPFGHGKLEGVLSVAQGTLLIGILVSLVAGALQGLVEGRAAPNVPLAVGTLVGGALVSAFLTWRLHRATASDDSLILAADAAHYRLDFLAGALAVGGLLAIGGTGWTWIDPVLCLALALFMGPTCYGLLRDGTAQLLDEALPEESQALVVEILERLALEYHGLRTRRSGPLDFVEVHLDLDPNMPLGEAHGLVQAVGDEIRDALPGCRVLVHPDARGLRDRVDESLDEAGARGPAPA